MQIAPSNLHPAHSHTTFRPPMENIVIIGSGCAGWTAALYTARANLQPLVLTGRQPGGLLTTTSIVENFPGFPEGVDGYELMARMQKQAERFGARSNFGTVESVDFSKRPFTLTVDGERVGALAVIIASDSGECARKPGGVRTPIVKRIIASAFRPSVRNSCGSNSLIASAVGGTTSDPTGEINRPPLVRTSPGRPVERGLSPLATTGRWGHGGHAARPFGVRCA